MNQLKFPTSILYSFTRIAKFRADAAKQLDSTGYAEFKSENSSYTDRLLDERTELSALDKRTVPCQK